MGSITRETDTDLFDGAAERTVEVALLEETYQDILALCRQEEWDEDEGRRIVMARGLAYLQGNAEIARLNSNDVDLAAELRDKVQQVADYHGMYSVMKLKAFKLLQVAQTLEMNVAGLRGELNLARSTIPMLRQKINELKTENAELRQRLIQAGLEAEADAGEETKPGHTTNTLTRPGSNARPVSTPWTRLRQWIAGT